ASSYDIETWLPGQNEGQGEYRETHSTSNCTDYQARSLNIRFSDKKNKKRFVHTVNGTAFALGRMIIAIIENYQKEDETIEIPGALKKFII
ncbi:serine--tRNA ligase, partial [bacterium]|nr:serine--tRNA ligase [bacterium]